MLKKQLRLAPKTWFLKRMRVYWISHILYLFFFFWGGGDWDKILLNMVACQEGSYLLQKWKNTIFVTYFAQDPNKIHIFFMTRVSYVSQDSRKIPSTVLKLAYRYIFFTVYQFFTQLIGILCPITFNICKYDKIHEIVCKNKQNLVKNM